MLVDYWIQNQPENFLENTSPVPKLYTEVNNRESFRKIAWVCEWYDLKALIF